MSLGWRREQMRTTEPLARSIIVHRTASLSQGLTL